NVWQKVTGPTVLGPLTGGGPDRDPTTNPVTQIYDNTANDARYYVGPIGSGNDQYYYGDPRIGGDGYLDSTADNKYGDDVIYYKNANGDMTTENPNDIVSVNVNPNIVTVIKGGTQTFTAQVLTRGNGANSDGVTWKVSPAGTGTSIDQNGVLTIGAGETNTTLTVTATSKKTSTISGAATVTVTDDPNAVKSVAINPSDVQVQKGSTQTFTATVTKNNGSTDGAGVTWTVSPAGGGTSIDQNGKLTVGDSETNATLTVTATSKTDPTVKSAAAVTVTAKPITDTPDIADDGSGNGGRVLTDDQTGDGKWVEIARNGGYSLIVRANYINTYSNGHYNDPSWQILNYASQAYKGSSVNNAINNWFNGANISGNQDKLSATARLRQFTVQNNAISALGTASTTAGMTNGFSKPTNVKIPSGSNDVAFALSYGEVANFCSITHDIRGANPQMQPSSNIATKNFAKITVPQVYEYGAWLRSSGDVSGTMGALDYTGRTFQFQLSSSTSSESGLVYPALWVDSAIFN
ncbi:MAG: hypothetical protein FWD71_18385, partial [Oscillospiraceae bacterium]|nr:hypothetical protein [Oscillospiraceae bacterium]